MMRTLVLLFTILSINSYCQRATVGYKILSTDEDLKEFNNEALQSRKKWFYYAPQWYWYLKFGVNQNFNNYQNVSGVTERNISTPDGGQRLIAIERKNAEINPNGSLKFTDFTLQFPVGIYVISPIFLTSGIEYQPISIRNLYRTNSLDSEGYFLLMDELNTLQTLSIPIFVDSRPFGRKLSVYAGFRYHLIIQNWQLQKVSWDKHSRLRKATFPESEFAKTHLSYAMGVNYSFISFELSVHPKTFVDKNYTDTYGQKPYAHIDQSIKTFTASLMLGRLYDEPSKRKKFRKLVIENEYEILNAKIFQARNNDYEYKKLIEQKAKINKNDTKKKINQLFDKKGYD
jgi:hypothetical protein